MCCGRGSEALAGEALVGQRDSATRCFTEPLGIKERISRCLMVFDNDESEINGPFRILVDPARRRDQTRVAQVQRREARSRAASSNRAPAPPRVGA